MTSPNSDPNSIDFDDFQLDSLNHTSENIETAKNSSLHLNLEKLPGDADPFDEFSVEELMALENLSTPATPTTELPHAVQSQHLTDPVVHTPISHSENNLGSEFDELFSLDAPMTTTHSLSDTEFPTLEKPTLDTPDLETPTLQTSASANSVDSLTDSTTHVPPVSTSTPSTDLDFNFDNDGSTVPTPVSATDTQGLDSLSTPNTTPTASTTDFSTAAGVAGAGLAGAAVLANQANNITPPPKKLFGLNLGKSKETKSVQPSTSTVPAKSLFGKKPAQPVVAKTPVGTPPTKHLVKTKKNNLLPLILLAAIAALAAGWWFLTQSEPEPTPTPAPVAKKTTPTPVASATPATVVANASAPVATVTAIASAPTASITNSSVAPTTTAKTTDTVTMNKTTLIKPEDITALALPADNATAKEEIDRLGQQSKQLEEQEKMMEEQLKMINELSSKKEERIAILEKQIAQIEAQKGQAAK